MKYIASIRGTLMKVIFRQTKLHLILYGFPFSSDLVNRHLQMLIPILKYLRDPFFHALDVDDAVKR